MRPLPSLSALVYPNRSHFDYVADAGADGVVVGSRIVNVIKSAPADKVSHSVEAFCSEITLKGQSPKARSPLPARSPAPVTNGKKDVSKDSSVSIYLRGLVNSAVNMSRSPWSIVWQNSRRPQICYKRPGVLEGIPVLL